MRTDSAVATNPDDIFLPNQPQPWAHPDRLAGIGILFGMNPRPVDNCRVLEIGCAAGGNLIPMAERHPGSTFVGIDESERQIAAGSDEINQLGLKNVELRCLSLFDVDESLEDFDFILCHGVYSWVGADVQEQILNICKSRLARQGIVYLGFNTYPGWHLRNIVRDLVCGCSAPSDPPEQRILQAAKVLRFVSSSMINDATPYAKLLKHEIDLVLRQPAGYLIHKPLGRDNQPLYFHEFVERASSHDLQYLGDASLNTMFAANFGPTIEQNLRELGDDVISIEQHMDLLCNRAFRQSLLCHKDLRIARQLAPTGLNRLYLSGRFRAEDTATELRSTDVERFFAQPSSRPSRASGVVSVQIPIVKAALTHLDQQWPRSVSYGDLRNAAVARLATADAPRSLSSRQENDLGQSLIQFLASGLMDAFSQPDSFVTSLSERPRASRLARRQAQTNTKVTNRRHEQVPLDELTQRLLHYLDGEHDRTELLKVLVEAADRGELSILVNRIPASRGDKVTTILEQFLDRSLADLAVNAILVA